MKREEMQTVLDAAKAEERRRDTADARYIASGIWLILREYDSLIERLTAALPDHALNQTRQSEEKP